MKPPEPPPPTHNSPGTAQFPHPGIPAAPPQSPLGSTPADASQVPIPQLRDIHQPPSVGLWPPAPGWWLLGLLLIVTLVQALRWGLKRWGNGAYRRAARRELDRAWQDYQETNDLQHYLQRFADILKRTALAGFQHERVAGLTGERWLTFLDSTIRFHNGERFHSSLGQLLLTGPYQPHQPHQQPQQPNREADIETLHHMGLTWIRKHRPHYLRVNDRQNNQRVKDRPEFKHAAS